MKYTVDHSAHGESRFPNPSQTFWKREISVRSCAVVGWCCFLETFLQHGDWVRYFYQRLVADE